MNLLKKDKECARINFHLGNLVLTFITDYITVPLRPLGAAIFMDSHMEKWLRQCSLCKSDSGGGMQVYKETCISLSCSKLGLYACTANDSANATFLFCLDSSRKPL